MGEARPLVFALNGTRVELSEVDPSLTLLTYLRTRTALRGTKRACGEGGCGACVVMVSRYDARTQEVEEITVNSCLTLLCSLDGCAVTTTEGLGSQQVGHHAIHKRMSGFHASQCGFCTPGMTMALYGTLRRSGACSLTAADAERAIAGNICRCTGYRPLLDTCKSFCADVDLEDLGLNNFQGKAPHYDSKCDPVFPAFLCESHSRHYANGNGVAHEVQPRFRFSDSPHAKEREKVWIDPQLLTEVLSALRTYQGAETEVKLVVGNTASGYYKDVKPQVYIDVSKVAELLTLSERADGMEVGASVTISNFIEFLQGVDGTVPGVLAAHLRKIASNHVRNWGSVGGNLMMAKLGETSSLILRPYCWE